MYYTHMSHALLAVGADARLTTTKDNKVYKNGIGTVRSFVLGLAAALTATHALVGPRAVEQYNTPFTNESMRHMHIYVCDVNLAMVSFSLSGSASTLITTVSRVEAYC